MSKVLERCVLRNIRDHLQQLINDSQHGFTPGKSCTTQLLEVLDYIGSLLDSGKQIDVVYMDMSKAFDKVHHKDLLSKLKNVYGIYGTLLCWFESYLLNRKQRVTVLGATSSARPVLSGVPQGSILQSDLNRLEKWSASSGLVFNQDKCKCHRVTRKKNPIKHEYKINSKSLVVTEKEKDLGIWITDTLHWSYHTHDRCTKANKMLGFQRRAAMEITDVKIRRTLYLSIVRSTLGYATQVWSPQSIDLITRTERIQRRATKFILKLPFVCAETYKDRLITLKLLPITYWHEYLNIMFFYKAINNFATISNEVLPQPITPSRLTRTTVDTNVLSFRPRKCKTLTYQRSFFIRVVRTFNSLPESLRQKNLSLVRFRSLLLEFYHNATRAVYDVDDVRTWRTVCSKCNTSRKLKQPLTCCY